MGLLRNSIAATRVLNSASVRQLYHIFAKVPLCKGLFVFILLTRMVDLLLILHKITFQEFIGYSS